VVAALLCSQVSGVFGKRGRRICLSGEELAMHWLRASLGGGERLELCVGGRAEILAVAHGTRKVIVSGGDSLFSPSPNRFT
jgi:hypothetical protein